MCRGQPQIVTPGAELPSLLLPRDALDRRRLVAGETEAAVGLLLAHRVLGDFRLVWRVAA